MTPRPEEASQELSILSAPERDFATLAEDDHPGSGHPNALSTLDSDILVVGAGVTGLCFARDMASLGYMVTIVERSSTIGGVWATNNYVGLRLHSPGLHYRNLSVVPKWNLEHEAEEQYRPTRDEVLEYCHQLAQHENIKILFNTECNHQEHEVVGNTISVQVGNERHTARFLFVSGTFAKCFNGQPHYPPTLASGFESIAGNPKCYHSSQVTNEILTRLGAENSQIIIVGASKAAVDILQSLPAGDESVLWAHRGHTAFFRRAGPGEHGWTFMHAQLACQKKAIEEGKGRDWSDIALEEGHLLKCEGPLTSQKVKTAVGICGEKEIAHANTFKQFHLSSIEGGGKQDNGISLVGQNGTTQLLGENTTIIFCTGQRNPDFAVPAVEDLYIRAGLYSGSIALSSLVPLCLAVQQLRGDKSTSTLASKYIRKRVEEFQRGTFKTDREADSFLPALSAEVNRMLYRDHPSMDPVHHRNWEKGGKDGWYRRSVQVHEFFDAFGVGKTSIPNRNFHAIKYDESARKMEEIMSILADVLGIQQGDIEPEMEIANMGMTSLQMVEVVQKVVDHFGVDLSPLILYECRTIQELAVFVDGSKKTEEEETPYDATNETFDNDTKDLEKWFVRQEGSKGSRDSTIVLLFPDISGKRVSTEFKGRHDIVSYSALYPWERNSIGDDASPVDALSGKGYIQAVCEAIAGGVQGYNFALVGVCAGGSPAYLVEQHLRRAFDLSPMTTTIVNGLPPPLSFVGTKRLFQRAVKENNLAAPKESYPFWKGVFRFSRKTWRAGAGVSSRLLLIGGEADKIVPRAALMKWLDGESTLNSAKVHIIKRGEHNALADPKLPGHKATWDVIQEELIMSRSVAPKTGRGFGPLRSTTLSMHDSEMTFYNIGLINERYRELGSFVLRGKVPLAEIIGTVGRVVMSDPRFIRFRSRVSTTKKQFEPISDWSAASHIALISAPKDTLKGQLWTIQVEHKSDHTVLHYNANHAVGDGYCCREFISAVLGTKGSEPPSLKLPFGSYHLQKRFKRDIEQLLEMYPPSAEKETQISTTGAKPVALCSLSVKAMKAYARANGGGSVNDVLLMLLSSIKRKMNEPHHWINSTIANRSAANWDDFRNESSIAPMFVGKDGSLSRIRDYTRKFKLLLACDYASGSSSLQDWLKSSKAKGSIGLLTNMYGVQTGSINGHALVGQRCHVSTPGMISCGSMGDIITCTYDVDESKLESSGEQVQKLWFEMASELGLISTEANETTNAFPQSPGSQVLDASTIRPRDTTLEDYEELHNMTATEKQADQILSRFHKILLFPYGCPKHHLSNFMVDPSGKSYYDLTLSTNTREATMAGQSARLLGQIVSVVNPMQYVANTNDKLRAETYVFDFLKEQLNSDSLRIIRHYEYQYLGKANVLMMALHIELDDGRVVLVEVLTKST